MEVSVNYLAVLVAAMASMVVGFVWYGFLFRKKWMELMGHTSEGGGHITSMSVNKAYTIQFVASLVMAYVLSHVITFASAYMEAGGLQAGLSSGFWMWLGFIAPVSLGVVLWENKPWKLWFINASHYLVMLLVMGAILAVWR